MLGGEHCCAAHCISRVFVEGALTVAFHGMHYRAEQRCIGQRMEDHPETRGDWQGALSDGSVRGYAYERSACARYASGGLSDR